MKTGIELIAAERERQKAPKDHGGEGWTEEHDNEHFDGQLRIAAACYALGPDGTHVLHTLNSARGIDENCYPMEYSECKPEQVTWPWGSEWWKPSPDPIYNLIKAGALIAAEIDRLQRLRQPPS